MSKLPFLPLTAAVLMAVVITTPAQDAKPTPDKPKTQAERLQRMKELLNLTPEQEAKVKEVYAKNRDKMREAKSAGGQTAKDVYTAVQEEVYAVLTPEQTTQWKEELKRQRTAVGR